MAYRYGIYLTVHNASALVYAALNKGIYLSPGTDTYVDVSRTTFKKHKSKYRPCFANSEDFRKKSPGLAEWFEFFYKPFEYEQDFCRDLCLQLNIYNHCNCCDVFIGCPPTTFCSTDDALECSKTFTKNFLANFKPCEDICLPKCETQSFTLLNSQSAFPANEYTWDMLSKLPEPPNYAEPNYNYFFVKESILSFTVNYNSLSYTYIEEQPSFTFSQFVGNLGGQLGLCIGISLLSFVEVLELISELCILFYYKKIAKKKRPEPENTFAHPFYVNRLPLQISTPIR